MEGENAGRVRCAVTAAQSVARQCGVPADQPRVLADANNVVVHLGPSRVVAKVTGCAGTGGWERLAAEVAVGRHLDGAGARVAGPCTDLPPGPHVSGDFAMTFWRHHDHDPGAVVCGRLAAEVIEEVHRALEDYSGPLRSFLGRRVRRTGHVLDQPLCQSALDAGDRDFLRHEYLSILSTLDEHRLENRTLHGDPHRGNFLVTPSGHLLIDFESVCSGPREWDLSALPGNGEGLSGIDDELLMLLRRLRSVCVTVWCSARSAHSNALRNAAKTHLAMLRKAA